MRQLSDNIIAMGPPDLGPDCAVLAIHWQNDVVSPLGALGSTFSASAAERNIVARTAALFDRARAAGASVIYVNVEHDPGYPALVRNNAVFNTVAKSNLFLRGTQGAAIIDALAPQPGEPVLSHTRISCFYGTNLLEILIGRNIRRLFLTGVATNVAVDHTARDAAEMGFGVYLVEDCCGTADARFHDMALETLKILCTAIVTSDRIGAA